MVTTSSENNMKLTDNESKFKTLFYILAVVILVVVGVLGRLPKAESIPDFVKKLPLLNAILNGTCSILLLTSFYFIRRKKITIHKSLNLVALTLSALFLVSYVLFHFYVQETSYPATNPLRPFYLTILISHILLAGTCVPLVLLTFYYGLKNKTDQHRKIARYTFPIWLYVTTTGVAVYLMIAPYYTF